MVEGENGASGASATVDGRLLWECDGYLFCFCKVYALLLLLLFSSVKSRIQSVSIFPTIFFFFYPIT